MGTRRLPESGNLTSMGSPGFIKGSRWPPWFPQPLCSSPHFFYLTSKTSGLVPCYLFFLTTFHIIMLPKAALTFLLLGALSINALTVVIPRSPVPEPECEPPTGRSLPYYITV